MKRVGLGFALIVLLAHNARSQGVGSIYVTANTPAPQVIRVNPANGFQTTVASAGNLLNGISGVAVGPTGDLFVANSTQVVKVNATTGVQTIVSSGNNLTAAFGIAVVGANIPGLTAGDIYVANVPFNAASKVIRIDPASGAQTVIASGGMLSVQSSLGMGVAIGGNGGIFVNSPASALLQIDPTNGFQTKLASLSGSGMAIAVDGNGNVVVPDGIGGLIRVNATTGVISTVTIPGTISSVRGIAADASGNLVVTRPDNNPGSSGMTLYGINTTTNAISTIASGIPMPNGAASGQVAVYAAAIPTSAVSGTAGTYHVFPQFADGRAADGSYYRSTLMISNPSASVSASCTFKLYGLALASFTATYNLGPSGWAIQPSTGTQNFQAGYGTLQCTSNVEAQLLYSLYASSGAKLGEATVFAAPAASVVQILADNREGADVGMAIANNSDQAITYTIAAADLNGNSVGTTTQQVPARTSIAKFVSQFLTLPANYYGQVIVSSNSGLASIIGLRFTGAVFTTIPQTIRR